MFAVVQVLVVSAAAALAEALLPVGPEEADRVGSLIGGRAALTAEQAVAAVAVAPAVAVVAVAAAEEIGVAAVAAAAAGAAAASSAREVTTRAVTPPDPLPERRSLRWTQPCVNFM